MRLTGEIALVTGSTAGIGKAIAVEFATEGARVVVHGRDAERGGAVVEQIEASGGAARFVAADLATEDACTALVEDSAGCFDGLTVLVNNAVASPDGHDSAVGAMDTGYWEHALRVNLTAPMWVTRAALPHLLSAGHGSIVNVSSRQAERPSAGLAAYAASKGGLNALTRALAVEHAAGRDPGQHDQPRVRDQRAPRRRVPAGAPRPARGDAPHPARDGPRRRVGGRIPRQPRVRAAHRHQLDPRRWEQHRPGRVVRLTG